MTNILLTGASRRIGAAIADTLSAHPDVTFVGHGTRSGIAADFADPAGPRGLWDAALAQLGSIDVLINNAGIFEPVTVESPTEAWRRAWARVMQVNVYAPAELSKLAIAHFRRHGGGKIINIASRAAHRGDAPDQWAYAASKGALVALTKTIARGFARDNVLAFAIAPGFTDTDMAYTGVDEEGIKRIIADIPLGSMASPAECGALAAFLCSDQVRHLTGATFDINGASYVR